MRPLRIAARNVVAYREIDLDVSALRHAVIVGENGAGKTLLVDLVRVGLVDHGRLGPRALAGMIGRWGDTASVVLEFEHGGAVYRSTRTRRRAGKATSRTDVLEMQTPDGWRTVPLTVEDVIGATADTLGATSFLRYRGVDGLGDFGASAPTDRRAILSALRGTGRYAELATAAGRHVASASALLTAAATTRVRLQEERRQALARAALLDAHRAGLDVARAELTAAEDALAEARVADARRVEARQRLDRACDALAGVQRRVTARTAEVARLEARMADSRRMLGQAEEVRAAVAERERLLIAHRDATAELATAREAEVAAVRAAEVATVAVRTAEEGNRIVDGRERAQAELAEIAAERAYLTGIVGAVSGLMATQAALEADRHRAAGLATVPCGGEGSYATCRYLVEAVAARDRWAAQVGQGIAAYQELVAACQSLPDLLAALESGDVTAIRAAHAAMSRRLTSDLTRREGELAATIAAGAGHRHTDVAPLEAARVAAEAEAAVQTEQVTALRYRIRAIEQAGRALATLVQQADAVAGAQAALDADAATLAALGGGDDLADALRAAQAEYDEAAWADGVTVSSALLATTQARVDVARVRAEQGARSVAEAEAAQATAEARAEALEALVAEERSHERAKAVAGLLRRFYVEAPQLIAENDRQAIEAAANDWLARTSALGLELVFQRPLATDAGRVRETLEVDVLRPSGRAVRETCSGGELFRVDVGLAVGLGRAMGAGRSWLCIDEGFGSLKGDVVAQVTRSLEGMLADLDGLWVVTHIPQVIDVFPARLVVRAGPDGSTVEVCDG